MNEACTADDLRRNIKIYRDEAERSRKWADVRRKESDTELKRARAMDRRADDLQFLLSFTKDRVPRPARRRVAEAERGQ